MSDIKNYKLRKLSKNNRKSEEDDDDSDRNFPEENIKRKYKRLKHSHFFSSASMLHILKI